MIDSLSAHPWLAKAVLAVSTATVLGAGHTIINNKVDLVKLQEQVQEIAQVRDDLKATNRSLQGISRDLAILVDREDRRHDEQSN